MDGCQNTSEFVKNVENNHQGAWTRGLSTIKYLLLQVFCLCLVWGTVVYKMSSLKSLYTPVFTQVPVG